MPVTEMQPFVSATCEPTRDGMAFVLSGLDQTLRTAAGDLGFDDAEGRYRRTVKTPAHLAALVCTNFECHAHEMLLQAARLRPIPWEEALTTFADSAAAANARWLLVGSAALAVRGVTVSPRDVDVVVASDGLEWIDTALREHLLEPTAPTGGWIAALWGRAFLGARVEWIAEPAPDADLPEPSDYGSTAWRTAEPITWRDRQILVPRLPLQRAVAVRRGLLDRVSAIDRMLRA